jgi:hypothetical protein
MRVTDGVCLEPRCKIVWESFTRWSDFLEVTVSFRFIYRRPV